MLIYPVGKYLLISIHALREEGDCLSWSECPCSPISIHALREEGDAIRHRKYSPLLLHFYPRPPRGGRHRTLAAASKTLPFLSTPSARRATLC